VSFFSRLRTLRDEDHNVLRQGTRAAPRNVTSMIAGGTETEGKKVAPPSLDAATSTIMGVEEEY